MRNANQQLAATRNKLFLLISILFFSPQFSQTITGTVTDVDKNPIGSVTVQVKGSSRTTLTDVAGKFSIGASAKDTLVFTSIGFIRQEIAVNGSQTLSVTMHTDVRNMEDVLVTALGISKRSRGLGYSATNVKPEELTVGRTPIPLMRWKENCRSEYYKFRNRSCWFFQSEDQGTISHYRR
jgi:hypothetical protein